MGGRWVFDGCLARGMPIMYQALGAMLSRGSGQDDIAELQVCTHRPRVRCARHVMTRACCTRGCRCRTARANCHHQL